MKSRRARQKVAVLHFAANNVERGKTSFSKNKSRYGTTLQREENLENVDVAPSFINGR